MSESRATNSHQPPPFVYGQILARSAHEAAMRSKIPGIGRFLTQGMAAGAFLFFVPPVFFILYTSGPGYYFLMALLLPIYLVVGMSLGVVQGIVIWASRSEEHTSELQSPCN